MVDGCHSHCYWGEIIASNTRGTTNADTVGSLIGFRIFDFFSTYIFAVWDYKSKRIEISIVSEWDATSMNLALFLLDNIHTEMSVSVAILSSDHLLSKILIKSALTQNQLIR